MEKNHTERSPFFGEVVVVGPMPPPVHGFSNANLAMCRLLQRRATVSIFDRAAKLNKNDERLPNVARTLNYLRELFRYARTLRGCVSVYLGLSGSWGQLLDFPYLILARLAGKRVYIHHHSFSYIDRHKWLAKLVFSSTKRATHIVLCSTMGKKLADLYNIREADIEVLSNLSFQDEAPFSISNQKVSESSDSLKVGFFSNVTQEKGIFTFLDIACQTSGLGQVHFYVAGPVSAEINEEFERRISHLPNCCYVGPLYGESKDRYLSSLDILLFPSRYTNEAEPLVIHEALLHGVKVIATNRGCICEVLDVHELGITSSEDEFARIAVEEIRTVTQALSSSENKGKSLRALAHRSRMRDQNKHLLELVDRITSSGVG